MYKLFLSQIHTLYLKKAPATGIGLFRICFGLITFQEILFLIYFNHLIFDPIPYLDVEFPMIVFFLWAWAAIALALTLGYQCQLTVIANYLFWLVFVNFTPMQRDFDGGFDLFMIGANFFLIFMPIDKSFALDALRKKLANPFLHYSAYPEAQVSTLVYYLPVIICLGFLYFDSVIHKMFAEHWLNGLGAWLPSSIPYYISALDLSWLLNQEYLQKFIGYTIIVFQFTFLFFFFRQRLRPLFFWVGVSLHLGITLSFNIYPFGLGMLSFYTLVMPFSWYRRLESLIRWQKPRLTVFYDRLCPLCCRTVLTLNHFDIMHGVDFKAAQDYAKHYPQLDQFDGPQLLTDLYALDDKEHIYSGVATYSQILIAMGYPAIFGYFLKMPVIYPIACRYYRRIADNRIRQQCDSSCDITLRPEPAQTLYTRIFEPELTLTAKKYSHKITKVLLVIILLQLNSTIHYGLLYRFHVNTRQNPLCSALTDMSNTLLMFSGTFLGITPHALYLHDHFAGYEHLLAISYLDESGKEQFLPFIDEHGRLLAPNWGRVHSMWANIAVTPNIDEFRLKKFIMKVTAFWGTKSGLDLEKTHFLIKMKKIRAPFVWEKDLRYKNLSGEWQIVGSAQWRDREVKITLLQDIDTI